MWWWGENGACNSNGLVRCRETRSEREQVEKSANSINEKTKQNKIKGEKTKIKETGSETMRNQGGGKKKRWEMGTHFFTEQDDQTVPTPDASHHWMFMIAGLHLYIAPKRSNGAIAVMIISIHSSYNTERPGPKNGQGTAGGGNPNVGLHNSFLTGTAKPT